MQNMRRRRSIPWIYRWSRPLIGAIAIIGALLTAYLTIEKLTGGEVACTMEAIQSGAGCNDVLSSAYATVFGLPLSLFGFLAYTSMATFALVPLAVQGESNKKLRNQLENWSWLLLLIGGTAMAVFSSYLMYILASEIKAVCPYCIASALFSWSLLILSIIGRNWEDTGQIFFTIFIVAILTLVAVLGIYSQVNVATNNNSERVAIAEPEGNPKPPIGWAITTASTKAEIDLAKHLSKTGVTKYGAWWCPHCYEQKQLFGKEAFKQINYVECDPRGKTPQPQLCKDKGITSFPTWEVDGKFYRGVQTPDKLAELSEYEGAKNFKYTMP